MFAVFKRLLYSLGFTGAGYYAAVRKKQPIPKLQPPVVRLGGISYVALAHDIPELQKCKLNDLLPDEYRPVVVVSIDKNSSYATLPDWVETTEDDVFSRYFLTDTVIVQGSRQDVERLRRSWPTSSSWHPTQFLSVPTPKRLLPNGPYFLGAGLRLYQAWRLYPDTQGSFVTPLLPTTVGAELSSYDFRPLEVRFDDIWTAVAVPSRLYSERSQSKPLAGLRFSIKDNFKLSGTISTQSNRAWCELYRILSRNIEGMQMLVKQTISSAQIENANASRPTEILYPEDFFPMENPEQQALVERFIGDLESAIGIKATKISISERWRVSPPQEAGGRSIQEFLDKVAYNPFYYDGYHEYDAFRKQYKETFGKPVYVGPYMRWKWDRGFEVTEDMKSKSMEDVEIYRRWFEQNILHSTPNGGTSAIMLIPCGSSGPKYLGHIPYDSRVTKCEEQLPVVGSIIGAPGSDLLLTNLARDALEKAGRPTTVLTGRNMFSAGVEG
ncbi:hypothetical protein B0I35DRAFT_455416 [Stachybotrys elegans]|uniref:Amidase domain-containing protein n=1 Tax=Stachybotrys elegans TaxID=80388 RepID=A0A8K0SCH9_9HYPO|nr:hypothetical protein B0I35DRAFT_455416 [Stachybotrys elegans]